jgi:hypothetical protein
MLLCLGKLPSFGIFQAFSCALNSEIYASETFSIFHGLPFQLYHVIARWRLRVLVNPKPLLALCDIEFRSNTSATAELERNGFCGVFRDVVSWAA